MLYMHAKIRERKAARKTKLSRAEAHNERSALLAKFHTLPAEEREPFETKAKIQNMRRKTEKSHGSQCNDPDLQYGIAVGDSLWGLFSREQPIRPEVIEHEAKLLFPDRPVHPGFTSGMADLRREFLDKSFVHDSGHVCDLEI